MKIYFDQLYYHFYDENLIEIAFRLSDKNRFLVYKRHEFQVCSILNPLKGWNKKDLSGCITAIRRNEDYEYLLKIENNCIIKICFCGCNYTKDGIIENFTTIDENSLSYKSITDDFNNSEEIEIPSL